MLSKRSNLGKKEKKAGPILQPGPAASWHHRASAHRGGGRPQDSPGEAPASGVRQRGCPRDLAVGRGAAGVESKKKKQAQNDVRKNKTQARKPLRQHKAKLEGTTCPMGRFPELPGALGFGCAGNRTCSVWSSVKGDSAASRAGPRVQASSVVPCPVCPHHVQGQELDLQRRLNRSILEPVIPRPRRTRRGHSSLSSPG